MKKALYVLAAVLLMAVFFAGALPPIVAEAAGDDAPAQILMQEGFVAASSGGPVWVVTFDHGGKIGVMASPSYYVRRAGETMGLPPEHQADIGFVGWYGVPSPSARVFQPPNL